MIISTGFFGKMGYFRGKISQLFGFPGFFAWEKAGKEREIRGINVH